MMMIAEMGTAVASIATACEQMINVYNIPIPSKLYSTLQLGALQIL